MRQCHDPIETLMAAAAVAARAWRANAAVIGERSRAASEGALSDRSVNAFGWNLHACTTV